MANKPETVGTSPLRLKVLHTSSATGDSPNLQYQWRVPVAGDLHPKVMLAIIAKNVRSFFGENLGTDPHDLTSPRNGEVIYFLRGESREKRENLQALLHPTKLSQVSEYGAQLDWLGLRTPYIGYLYSTGIDTNPQPGLMIVISALDASREIAELYTETCFPIERNPRAIIESRIRDFYQKATRPPEQQ